MQDQPYQDPRPPLARERDRIAAVLRIAGVTLVGGSISTTDGVADLAWQDEGGGLWMAVISPLEPALWAQWQDQADPQDGQPPEDEAGQP